MKKWNIDKIVKWATIGIVVYLLCFGVAEAFFPIRPFWNDEWRLIYNLKFKTESQLWGRLDLLQQCPRVLLTLFKKITSAFDYSYTSLRLPALVLTIINVLFCFYMKRKIFPGSQVFSNLFILIFISSQTFTDYMVQMKHYEMDIFLTLLALWQLMTLLDLLDGLPVTTGRYIMLCLGFAAAPYFSYIYPIVIAPVFAVVCINSFAARPEHNTPRGKQVLSISFPLLLCTISIVVFYMIDVKQLLADAGMYKSYRDMLGKEAVTNTTLTDLWNLFALVGSGLLFEIVFGVIGIAAFVYGVYRLTRRPLKSYSRTDTYRLYGILLILLTIALILSGKVMGGVARLTVFTVPSISLFIVSLLSDMEDTARYRKVAYTLTTILFLGLVGNILSTCINTFTYPEYSNRIKTFRQTQKALKLATDLHIPILYTDGIRGDVVKDTTTAPGKADPDQITPEQIAGLDRLCTEAILKVNPGFNTNKPIPLYWIPATRWMAAYWQQLPLKYDSIVLTDGVNYSVVKR